MGPAFASLFVGSILSGPNEENPFVIIIIFFSLGFFYLVAFVFVRRITLSKESYSNQQIM